MYSDVEDKGPFVLGLAHQNLFVQNLIGVFNQPMSVTAIARAITESEELSLDKRQRANLRFMLRRHREDYICVRHKYWPSCLPYPQHKSRRKRRTCGFGHDHIIGRMQHLEDVRYARRKLAEVERVAAAVPARQRIELRTLNVDETVWDLVDGSEWAQFARNTIKAKQRPLALTELELQMAASKVALKSCSYRNLMKLWLSKKFVYVANTGYWPVNTSILLEDQPRTIVSRGSKRAADPCPFGAEIRELPSPAQCEKPTPLVTV